MICCCSLAGTKACLNCNNGPWTNTPPPAKINLNDYLKFDNRTNSIEIICKKCGKILNPYDNFCSFCGKEVEVHINDDFKYY